MTKINFKHISNYKTPDESPGYLLWRVSTVWRTAIEAALKPLNLTHPQFATLASLSWLTKNGESINQTDISKMTGLDPNTTSQILRGLEAKKFIMRAHLLNERSKSPTLTTVGSETLKLALPAVEKADAHFFAKLTNNETDIIVQLFQKLKNRTLS